MKHENAIKAAVDLIGSEIRQLIDYRPDTLTDIQDTAEFYVKASNLLKRLDSFHDAILELRNRLDAEINTAEQFLDVKSRLQVQKYDEYPVIINIDGYIVILNDSNHTSYPVQFKRI